MVASSSGRISGSAASSPPRARIGASASSIVFSTGSATCSNAQPASASRCARGPSATISFGVVSARPWRISSASHQPLTRVAIAARLQRRHIGDDPGRAVAHRNGDAIALPDAEAADERLGGAGRCVVELGESQPLVGGDHGFARAVQRAEEIEHPRQRRRETGDDRAPFRVAAELDRTAGAGYLRQHRIIFAVKRARHSLALSVSLGHP